ncbi:MAG: GNAT family N-acetyltransferase [Verrucomicrobiota bacterium]
MPVFTTRPARLSDLEIWTDLRGQLWPDHNGHAYDLQQFFTSPQACQMAYMVLPDHAPENVVGFIELSLRHDLLTRGNTPVAYIEGWFVSEFMRHAGAGKALIAAAETWASEQGCREITSECGIDNETSASAHLSCGFSETRRMIAFHKKI